MNRHLGLCLALAFVTCLSGNLSLGQAPGQAPPPAPQAPAATIKLQVVLSRYDGDKKLSSLPYTLSLVPGQPGNIRAGAEIAVPTTTMGGDKAMVSYTMQQVGSQIDATVTPTSDGKYNLKLSVTDRSVVTGAQAAQGGMPNVPSFRNMVSTSQAIMSGGETMQFTASSDRAANETFRIDVTLTVGNK